MEDPEGVSQPEVDAGRLDERGVPRLDSYPSVPDELVDGGVR